MVYEYNMHGKSFGANDFSEYSRITSFRNENRVMRRESCGSSVYDSSTRTTINTQCAVRVVFVFWALGNQVLATKFYAFKSSRSIDHIAFEVIFNTHHRFLKTFFDDLRVIIEFGYRVQIPQIQFWHDTAIKLVTFSYWFRKGEHNDRVGSRDGWHEEDSRLYAVRSSPPQSTFNVTDSFYFYRYLRSFCIINYTLHTIVLAVQTFNTHNFIPRIRCAVSLSHTLLFYLL